MGKISYSQFAKWDKCPYTWKLDYVDKETTFYGNIYTLFGTAVHETIQAYLVCYYERTIKQADNLPLRDILQYRMEENYKIAKEQYGDEFEVTLEEMKEFFNDGCNIIDEFLKSCQKLSESKTGALFVIERNNSLDFVKNSGDELYVEISTPIIESIFFKNSPLHDGAVIIDGNFITAARVILPISENQNIDPRLGLRHRAAFGITEKTDAIALVLSEENKKITFIKNGEIFSYKNFENLKTMIEAELV